MAIKKEYKNKWIFKNNFFESDHINNIHGFIYVIQEKSSGKYYIGQKHFWTKRIKTVNGKKKKVKVESDWKHYYSSSNYINEKVSNEGTDDFIRYIVALVKSDGMLNYLEMKWQVDASVLENEDKFINGYIGGRISRSHISLDKVEFIDYDFLKNTIFSHVK